MKIKEVKQNAEYDNFLEVSLDSIDRIFTVDISRFKNSKELEENLERRIKNYLRRMEQEKKPQQNPEDIKKDLIKLKGKEITLE